MNSEPAFCAIDCWAIGRSENLEGRKASSGGHNLQPRVGIELTKLPDSGGAKVSPAPPLTTALKCYVSENLTLFMDVRALVRI